MDTSGNAGGDKPGRTEKKPEGENKGCTEVRNGRNNKKKETRASTYNGGINGGNGESSRPSPGRQIVAMEQDPGADKNLMEINTKQSESRLNIEMGTEEQRIGN